MLKSLGTSLIARGILAVIVGIIALAWPSVTVLALRVRICSRHPGASPSALLHLPGYPPA